MTTSTRLQDAEAQLAASRAALAEAEAALREWDDRVEDEREDVQVLDRVRSDEVTSEEYREVIARLGTERHELKEALEAHREATARVDALRAEVAAKEAELERVQQAEVDLRWLVEESGGDPEHIPAPLVDRFHAKSDELVGLAADIERFEEAIRLGRSAERMLTTAKRQASTAMRWGYLDMVAGGVFVSAAKFSAADEAKRLADNTRVHLMAIRRLVDEVRVSTEIVPGVSGVTRGFDYLLDTDLLSLPEISRARASIGEAHKGVVALNRRLRVLLAHALKARGRLDRERRALVRTSFHSPAA